MKKKDIDFNFYISSNGNVALKDFIEVSSHLNNVYALVAEKLKSEINTYKIINTFDKNEVGDIKIVDIKMGSILVKLRAHAGVFLLSLELIAATLSITDSVSSLQENLENEPQIIIHDNSETIIIKNIENNYFDSYKLSDVEKRIFFDDQEINESIQELIKGLNFNPDFKDVSLSVKTESGEELVIKLKSE